MRIIPTNQTHGQSHHPLHESWSHWVSRMRKKGITLPPEALDWPTFRTLNPFPPAWLAGQVDASPGLIDPNLGYITTNIGWITRPKRRES